MAPGWAVGVAAALATSTALLALDPPQGPHADAAHPAQLVLAALAVALWAYGGILAAHGSRGALAGLAVYALLWAALPGGLVASGCLVGADECRPLTVGVAVVDLIAGVLAGYAAIMEALQRRGSMQWRTAVFLLLPLAGLGLVLGVQAITGS